MTFKLIFPENYDEYAWEAEAKGYLTGVTVTVKELTISLLFYDPVRLAQDIEEMISLNQVFAEKNVVVVSNVNRITIETAVASLFGTGDIYRLT